MKNFYEKPINNNELEDFVKEARKNFSSILLKIHQDKLDKEKYPKGSDSYEIFTRLTQTVVEAFDAIKKDKKWVKNETTFKLYNPDHGLDIFEIIKTEDPFEFLERYASFLNKTPEENLAKSPFQENVAQKFQTNEHEEDKLVEEFEFIEKNFKLQIPTKTGMSEAEAIRFVKAMVDFFNPLWQSNNRISNIMKYFGSRIEVSKLENGELEVIISNEVEKESFLKVFNKKEIITLNKLYI